MSDRTPDGSAASAELFERRVRAHHAAVYRSALRITRHDADARDVAQQVFLKLLTGSLDLTEAHDEERVLRWWAVRLALASQRRARRRALREQDHAEARSRADAPEPEQDSSMSHAFTSHATETPAHAAARAESRARLEALVAALPGELRLPLELRFRENLTFAAIGAELELSEPAVHGRVERALARLRRELSRAGLGAFGFELERELALEPACPVPNGLATQLLALQVPAASAGFLGAPLLAALIALVLALAGAAWFVRSGAPEPARVARDAQLGDPVRAPANSEAASEPVAPGRESLGAAANAVTAAAQGPGPVPPPPRPSTTPFGTATLTGRVVDESGLGVGGADVWAGEPAKGFPHFSAASHGATRPDGSFAFEVALARANVLVEVRADHAEYAPLARTETKLSAGATARVPDIVVRRVSDDRPGDFTLALTLVDGAGAPCANVPVRLFRRGKTFAGTAGDEWESGGVSDAFGRVDLAGKHLGRKLLVVEAAEQGWRRVRTRFEIAGAGPRAETLVLERGPVLAGRVLTLAGEPVADASVYATCLADEERSAEQTRTDALGHFRLPGLDPGEWSLQVDGGAFSPATVRAAAGREDLELRLKLADDARDVGDHRAELHGSLRDARTGAPVPLPWGSVEVERVTSTTRAEFLAGEYLAHLRPVPRQVASTGDWQEPPPSAVFHATGLAPGRYVAVVRAQDRACAFAGPFELGEHTLVSDIVLELAPAPRFTLRVIGPDGAPVARAWLVCAAADSGAERLAELDRELVRAAGEPREWWGVSRTDARGECVLDDAPPGSVARVFALHADFAPAASAPLSIGADGTAVLQLGRAR